MNRRHLLAATAVGAVDIALWDIVGKALGKPVYALLDGSAEHPSRLNANGDWRAPAHALGIRVAGA